MALLNVQPIAAAGSAPVLGAASGGGDTVRRQDNGFLLVKNASGAPINVTLDTPGTTHGLAIADQVTAVAAGATAVIPISDEVFVHPDDDLIHVAYSSVVTVTVAACAL